MVIPMTYISTHDKTVGDNQLEEYKGSYDCNEVCFLIVFTRLITECFRPYPPYLPHFFFFFFLLGLNTPRDLRMNRLVTVQNTTYHPFIVYAKLRAIVTRSPSNVEGGTACSMFDRNIISVLSIGGPIILRICSSVLRTIFLGGSIHVASGLLNVVPGAPLGTLTKYIAENILLQWVWNS